MRRLLLHLGGWGAAMTLVGCTPGGSSDTQPAATDNASFTVATSPAATSSTSPTTSGPEVVLAKSGVCGDAYFWAVNRAETLAVTISVAARYRSSTTSTKVDLSPAAAPRSLDVNVFRGDELGSHFCTDVIVGSPPARIAAATITGSLVLAPRGHAFRCGGRATLRLDSLHFGDGWSARPTKLVAQGLGCYAG
ncbi:MAG: hypothetical protein ACR2LE_05475 [Nocardioidaceae bacterium]